MVGPVGELAETTSLLRMRSRKITEGSNPSLSAIDFPLFFLVYCFWVLSQMRWRWFYLLNLKLCGFDAWSGVGIWSDNPLKMT